MEAERERYRLLLTQVKARLDLSHALLTPPADILRVEFAALNIRKSIELVVLGALVNNLEEVRRVSSAFDQQDWKEARKLVRRVNPNFWPVPSVQAPDASSGVVHLVDVSAPHLTESEAGRAWGLASELLHATNPFQPEPDATKWAAIVLDIFNKLVTLLNHHQIFFTDDRFMAIASMHTVGATGMPDGFIQVALFDRVNNGP
jgi:hypothetical protein